MTGPEHSTVAERFSSTHRPWWTPMFIPPIRGELVEPQAVIVAMAHTHAALADAAVAGLRRIWTQLTRGPGGRFPAPR